ncbi:MAG: transporter substrate-binding domain-containing protein [Bacilli bacterium]|nr:transporter substrate-binding domain-containing protein [Bacilli bacterium]
MNKAKLILCSALMVGLVTPLSSCNSSSSLAIVHFEQSILGETQKDLSVSIGVQKDSELTDSLNSVLADISADTRNTLMTEATERATALEQVQGDSSETVLTEAPYDETKETLIVGMEANYAPFNWTETSPSSYTYPLYDKTGEYADGYDVQIAKMCAENLDYNLVIKKYTWEALIPALNSGEINMIIAGMTDTPERRLSIDFTNPYYTSELVLIVSADSDLAEMTDLNDLNGRKVVSQIQTVTDDVIEEVLVPEYGAIHESALKTFSACATAVQTGVADAMTAEYPVAVSIVNGTTN